MVTFTPESLRNIKRFDQLIAYLRDELDWPIETDDFDDLTFDYEPEELGIDPKNAAKIEVIKQLRPLTNDQPWGIFWIKFKPQRLPVVALRRILGQLVVKKRATADRAERPAWELHDLMLISAVGEDDERQITFAHFADESDRTLPTLRVLGWDGADTVLKLDHLNKELHENLKWPEDESDHKAWRTQWSSAFKLRHREVINTSRELSVRLAELARNIRLRCNSALALETEKGPLRTLMGAFKQALIHDLNEDDFADMYAQTIAYGLLSARVSRHVPGEDAALLPEDVSALVLPTNPFLKELMETFFHVGGRKSSTKKGRLIGIDFDELGINDVVDLLKAANMDAVLRDFGDKNPKEDPVIHFYELFLKEYDAKKRMQRGVFYTPRPVVSFIVRSVDELLRTEFGLADGLADTTTWGEMIERYPDLKLPEIDVTNPESKKVEKKPIDASKPFVQILDPATGTGTFLVEVIDIIYKTMTAKWETEGHMPLEFENLWNDYVPQHLLPRLHGYELMMAPYAIAHMKIGLKLKETGYNFDCDKRVRVYLTNALEPAKLFQLSFDIPALVHEAEAVNAVKCDQRYTVVIGNPPYASYGQLNKIPFILRLLADYKRGLAERNMSIRDDFIKFVKLSQHLLEQTGSGCFGMITNNAFYDAPTLRRMRESLFDSFSSIQLVNLHGSQKKGEVSPDGSNDENVFDITVGVGVTFLAKSPTSQYVRAIDVWGSRSSKYERLTDNRTFDFKTLSPVPPDFYFVPKDFSLADEYRSAMSIPEMFLIGSSAIKTHRDELIVDFDRTRLVHKFQEIARSDDVQNLKKKFNINDTDYWTLAEAKRHIKEETVESNVHRYLYRPFDFRYIFYEPAIIERPRWEVMRHVLRPNLVFVCTRQTNPTAFTEILLTDALIDKRALASFTGEARAYPLFVYNEELTESRSGGSANGIPARSVNLSQRFLKLLAFGISEQQSKPYGLPFGVRAEDVINYVYAVLHSPMYRCRYHEFLKVDYPRVPIPASGSAMREVAKLGAQLVSLHLLSSGVEKLITTYTGPTEPEVEKVSYASGIDSDNTVWLDKKHTRGFVGVPEEVWNFHIGGYQVCEKWLKDRQKKGGKNPRPGRILTADDIDHYQKIIVALHETIRIMAEIDETIDAHGGWPDAFVTDPEKVK